MTDTPTTAPADDDLVKQIERREARLVDASAWNNRIEVSFVFITPSERNALIARIRAAETNAKDAWRVAGVREELHCGTKHKLREAERRIAELEARLAGYNPRDRLPEIDEIVVVETANGDAFKARLGIYDGDEPAAWMAGTEDLHPPCWSDGQYWACNADGDESTPVVRWWPLPAPPADGEPADD